VKAQTEVFAERERSRCQSREGRFVRTQVYKNVAGQGRTYEIRLEIANVLVLSLFYTKPDSRI